MSKKILHLICNSHIDPVWQWDWDEGASAALSTFYAACNLLDKYDFVFCHNEVIVYEYIEKYLSSKLQAAQNVDKAAEAPSSQSHCHTGSMCELQIKCKIFFFIIFCPLIVLFLYSQRLSPLILSVLYRLGVSRLDISSTLLVYQTHLLTLILRDCFYLIPQS